MSLIKILNNIKNEQSAPLTIHQQIFQVLLSFTAGAVLGFIAKYSDSVPSNGLAGITWGAISDITTRLGIWIMLAAIIAIYSRNPIIGAVKVFFFLSGMLLAYYIYSMWLFGFFPTYYFARWGLMALGSPLAAYFVWFSRGNGWFSAFCAALPIG
ncbi:MAG TPA: hypothetical protein VIG80_04565, partial [Bacillaceae bacterium]